MRQSKCDASKFTCFGLLSLEFKPKPKFLRVKDSGVFQSAKECPVPQKKRRSFKSTHVRPFWEPEREGTLSPSPWIPYFGTREQITLLGKNVHCLNRTVSFQIKVVSGRACVLE